jgi:hypoxanthine phosphoribosyltransferase
MSMDLYRPEVLISEEEIRLRIKELGLAITHEFQGEELVVLCVLKGAFMFCADLIKQISLPVRLEFIALSSYGSGVMSSGTVKLDMDLTANIEGKNVLIVEDIVDSGLTIKVLSEHLKLKKPKQIKLASLLFKPAKLQHNIEIDYLAFEIEDKFVIGYGLDYAGRYRELPYIGILNAGI